MIPLVAYGKLVGEGIRQAIYRTLPGVYQTSVPFLLPMDGFEG
jgi:hypothetical protein